MNKTQKVYLGKLTPSIQLSWSCPVATLPCVHLLMCPYLGGKQGIVYKVSQHCT